MLCCSKQPDENNLFQVPFGPVSTWGDIKNIYPDFVNEMDGSSEDSFILFYYEYNPCNGIYKPIDDDSEHDLANLFGLDLHNLSTGESKDDETIRSENISRSESLQHFMTSDWNVEVVCGGELSKAEVEQIKNAGITIEEYKKLNNESSIASSLSSLSFEDNEDNKRKIKSKESKKERRRRLVESRN